MFSKVFHELMTSAQNCIRFVSKYGVHPHLIVRNLPKKSFHRFNRNTAIHLCTLNNAKWKISPNESFMNYNHYVKRFISVLHRQNINL